MQWVPLKCIRIINNNHSVFYLHTRQLTQTTTSTTLQYSFTDTFTSFIMSYSLTTSYMGESLLSGFDWFNGDDLSNGFVS